MIDDLETNPLNPMTYQFMIDEDYLGKVKRIGKSCHGMTMVKRFFQRYQLYMAVRLEHRRRTGRLSLAT